MADRARDIAARHANDIEVSDGSKSDQGKAYPVAVLAAETLQTHATNSLLDEDDKLVFLRRALSSVSADAKYCFCDTIAGGCTPKLCWYSWD